MASPVRLQPPRRCGAPECGQWLPRVRAYNRAYCNHQCRARACRARFGARYLTEVQTRSRRTRSQRLARENAELRRRLAGQAAVTPQSKQPNPTED